MPPRGKFVRTVMLFFYVMFYVCVQDGRKVFPENHACARARTECRVRLLSRRPASVLSRSTPDVRGCCRVFVLIYLPSFFPSTLYSTTRAFAKRNFRYAELWREKNHGLTPLLLRSSSFCFVMESSFKQYFSVRPYLISSPKLLQ